MFDNPRGDGAFPGTRWPHDDDAQQRRHHHAAAAALTAGRGLGRSTASAAFRRSGQGEEEDGGGGWSRGRSSRGGPVAAFLAVSQGQEGKILYVKAPGGGGGG